MEFIVSYCIILYCIVLCCIIISYFIIYYYILLFILSSKSELFISGTYDINIYLIAICLLEFHGFKIFTAYKIFNIYQESLWFRTDSVFGHNSDLYTPWLLRKCWYRMSVIWIIIRKYVSNTVMIFLLLYCICLKAFVVWRFISSLSSSKVNAYRRQQSSKHFVVSISCMYRKSLEIKSIFWASDSIILLTYLLHYPPPPPPKKKSKCWMVSCDIDHVSYYMGSTCIPWRPAFREIRPTIHNEAWPITLTTIRWRAVTH